MTRPASDRCARPDDLCAKPGCGKRRYSNVHVNTLVWDHEFVEPPVTSTKETGEAAVRDIVDVWVGNFSDKANAPACIDGAAREAYAAGRTSAFDEAKTIARGAQSSNETLPGILLAMLAKQAQWIADAIAARAKETTK